jgi:hypothetical protein
MSKKQKKRFQVEIIFDGDAVDPVSASCTPVQNIDNWFSISWISEERGYDPQSSEMEAIAFLAYLFYDRLDLLYERAIYHDHEMPRLPNKVLKEKLKQLFQPGPELLKIANINKIKNYNNLKEGETDTVFFRRGKRLFFHVHLTFTNGNWQVTEIISGR